MGRRVGAKAGTRSEVLLTSLGHYPDLADRLAHDGLCLWLYRLSDGDRGELARLVLAGTPAPVVADWVEEHGGQTHWLRFLSTPARDETGDGGRDKG